MMRLRFNFLFMVFFRLLSLFLLYFIVVMF